MRASGRPAMTDEQVRQACRAARRPRCSTCSSPAACMPCLASTSRACCFRSIDHTSLRSLFLSHQAAAHGGPAARPSASAHQQPGPIQPPLSQPSAPPSLRHAGCCLCGPLHASLPSLPARPVCRRPHHRPPRPPAGGGGRRGARAAGSAAATHHVKGHSQVHAPRREQGSHARAVRIVMLSVRLEDWPTWLGSALIFKALLSILVFAKFSLIALKSAPQDFLPNSCA